MEPFDPPFQEFYKKLFDKNFINEPSPKSIESEALNEIRECEFDIEVPLIDLSRLHQGGFESEDCKREIARASQEWGFFQVVNHRVSPDVLEKMSCEQAKAFKKPFEEKVNGHHELNLPAGSYRWGTPSATCLQQLAWSEAFHVPLTDISTMDGVTGLSTTMKQYAKMVSNLAEKLAVILAENLGQNPLIFKENCVPSTCYIRMSRYPACPISPWIFGLMPHTDSDFLTILHQDQIGGLQILKNGNWIDVNPKHDTLIVMIGDLFQAWSNGVYKSVEHRVVANKCFERYSRAYFLCPSSETVIESFAEKSLYKRFSFKEFRQQVQDDVKTFGYKIGLPRFIL